jgi:hypothetical protein
MERRRENRESKELTACAGEGTCLARPELTAEQSIALAREYCNEHFASLGMCADICIHGKGDGNPHAHMMLTMRPMDEHGQWAAKSKRNTRLTAAVSAYN